MALRKITFNDKTDLNTTSVPDANKVKASDLNEIKSVINDNVDNIYPVGSIYLSTNSTNPGTLFGGTWVQIKDKFLLSAGDTYTAGATGGVATNDLSNKIHYSNASYGLTDASITGYADRTVVGIARPSGTSTDETAYSHFANINNMPPYLVVYVWKRTA